MGISVSSSLMPVKLPGSLIKSTKWMRHVL